MISIPWGLFCGLEKKKIYIYISLYVYFKIPCIYCSWIECSINISLAYLVDNVGQFFYDIIDLLSNFWESSIQVSNYHFSFFIFPFNSITFFFMYFEALLLGLVCLLGKLTPFYLREMILSITSIIFWNLACLILI